jgi:carbon-monoxide dehydrogenase small subunit
MEPTMTTTRRITMTVNGERHEADVEPRTTLVDFLRGTLALTGTHVGCEHGVCGACTILWNGKAVRSCIMLAVQADGAELQTVEGLAKDGTLHPIQQAFLECHGLQCGFSTPGFMMSISELLTRTSAPSEDDIVDTLGGHICRCTGYQAIREAVNVAVEKMRKPATGES